MAKKKAPKAKDVCRKLVKEYDYSNACWNWTFPQGKLADIVDMARLALKKPKKG